MAIKIRKPKKNRLGDAPKKESPKINNLTKTPPGKLVSLNFKVTAEFRKDYKQFALSTDSSMSDILKESFLLFKKENKI